MKEKLEELRALAIKLGAADAKLIESKDIIVKNSVRWGCRFGCENYGKNLMCPPYSPTPDETRKLLKEYEFALLFRQKVSPSDDYSSLFDSRLKLVRELERSAFLRGFHSAIGFTADSCRLCEKCNVTGGICIKPKLARPSMESCGVDVFSTARNVGYKMEVLTNKQQDYYYYGLILIK